MLYVNYISIKLEEKKSFTLVGKSVLGRHTPIKTKINAMKMIKIG